MKRRKITVTLCAVTLFIGMIVLSTLSERIVNAFSSGPATQPARTEQIPDQIVYDQLFRMVKTLDREAEKISLEGQDDRIWSEYFQREGGLNKEQEAVLKQIAEDFAREIAPIDARAKQIIDEVRAAYPNGEVRGGQLPEPPAELDALQGQRNEIAVRYRNQLNSSMGTYSFDKFDLFVQQEIASNMRPIEPDNPALKAWSDSQP